MTIAIGALATDGIVLAADTQETHFGFVKVNQGKVAFVLNDGPGQTPGALVVSGSGTAPHIDMISQQLFEWFSATCPKKISEVTDYVTKTVHAFSTDHILPYSHFAPNERPEIKLVIAAQVDGHCRLWTTEHSTVRVAPGFGAVGIGSAHANVLLSRLWRMADADAVERLVAYVLYCVKQEVDGCGNDTQLVVLTRKGLYTFERRRMELFDEQFRRLREESDVMTRYALGGKAGMSRGMASRLRAIREEIQRIDGTPLKASEDDRYAQAHRWIHDEHPNNKRLRSRR